jgi:hypothetical protein
MQTRTSGIHGVTWRDRTSSSDRREASLVNCFELLIDNLTREAVNGDVKPIPLFTFDDKLRQAAGRRRIAARLRDDVYSEVPRTSLNNFA